MNNFKFLKSSLLVSVISLSVTYATEVSNENLESQSKSECNETLNLVDVAKLNPKICVDVKYATADNFTKQIVYDSPRCFLLAEVAEAVNNVQKELEKEGLGLKIWDGYRPLSAQWKLWNIVSDERYVSDPRKGGRHTRGTAVDLTIISADGTELEMGTGFDDFTCKAHRDCTKVSQEAKSNRKKLEDIMVKYGFEPFQFEWWHFDYKGWEQCKSLDVKFEEIDKN